MHAPFEGVDMTDAEPVLHEAEFEIFLARAGMTMPAERRAGILANYADFRAQLDLLHTRRDATHEPSNIFRMKGVAR
jgi:hypothetical protein